MGRPINLDRFEKAVEKAIAPLKKLVADLPKQIETSEDAEEAIELLISALKQIGIDNDSIENLKSKLTHTKYQESNIE